MIAEVVETLKTGFRENRVRLNADKEASFHSASADALAVARVPFLSEYRISPKDRFDLWLPDHGIVIEIKLRPQLGTLISQLQRYASYTQVKGIILLTLTAPTGLPDVVGGKPVARVECWPFLLRM